jgi:hypothetical protein
MRKTIKSSLWTASVLVIGLVIYAWAAGLFKSKAAAAQTTSAKEPEVIKPTLHPTPTPAVQSEGRDGDHLARTSHGAQG